MKKIIALAVLSTFALAACKDDTQAKLEQQQKQIEALQQQLSQQNNQATAQEDNTVYQLAEDAVKDTIPAEALANNGNGEPVTGTDGQQYIYDQSTGSWLLQSLIGAAAGAFIGNALANKFTKANNQNSPVAQRARNSYYQSARPNARTSQQLNTRSVPAQNRAATTPNYRQTQAAPSNTRRAAPARRGFGRRR
ncbi:hypothetical protein CRG49_007435 [Neisseria sp. N95_16]|uniref:Uncharacterized protein n=1 Tax=Neisseria brasiliensis TaxID=2666100 RepID=A0A5Q3S7P8_9NEIS|nr:MULTISPECIES: hypothetical protein [Neisseria]MRN39333.1 hypothetical protein [Neisseria brasiliensis]PJO09471.1 hypothetical protein CRG49_007435 [Neisseria sp. N95_16]PJO77576.1 hypothetical protein CWC45_09755 [Neisseria sp. N177_16]QGL26148.1 hypothetical protein GJV52_11795 [Neisseria brasiliensis]